MSDTVELGPETRAWLEGLVKSMARAQTSQPARAAAPAASTGAAFRFGRSKGKPLTKGDDEGLEWYGKAIAENVADPSKARWRDDNAAHLAEVNAVLRSRGLNTFGSEPPPPPGFSDPAPSGAPSDDDIPF